MLNRIKQRAFKNRVSYIMLFIMAALFLLPTHMHLHHGDEHANVTHEHKIDYHIIYEQLDQDHGYTAVIDKTSDMMFKKLNNDTPFIVTLLLIVLALVITSLPLRHLRLSKHLLPLSHYSTTPPLRAPPLFAV